MFAVDKILISDELIGASFSCNLGACLGACCVQGDSGAPLEADECAELEKVLPVVEHRLRPEARKVIEERGVWEFASGGSYATTCVGSAECVFVVYEGPVAKCAIQQAHERGEVTFPKPISCHLYPLRVEDLGEFQAINYEQIGICASGRKSGTRQGMTLIEYLERPLSRKFGTEWYGRFREACSEREELFQETSR